MASTANNNKIRTIADKSLFASALNVISSTTTFNQGDHLVFDTGTRVIRNATTEATDSANYLGVALVTVVNGKLKSPFSTAVDASQAVVDIPGPLFGSVFKFTLKTGDVLNTGGAVYLFPTSAGGGEQFVSASGTNSIGIYQGPGVTGAASGTQVECLMGARYGLAGLIV